MDVGGQVSVAEVEPIGAAVGGQAFQGMKSFGAQAPAFSWIDHPRERVGDDIQVRRDLQAVEDNVVACVDDDRQKGRVHLFVKAEEQF